MRVLLTGGTGFVGSCVLNLLQGAEHDVVSISRRPGIAAYACDITDKSAVERARKEWGSFDVLMHTAARIPGSEHISYGEYVSANVAGTANLLDVFSDTKYVVYASTIDVYGAAHGEELTEETRENASSAYGATKLAGEHIIQAFGQERNVPVAILRLSQVYGPGEPPAKMIPRFIEQLKRKQPLSLQLPGTYRRRFLYVEDAGAAFMFALNNRISGVFNVAGADISTARDVVREFKHILGRSIEVHELPGAIDSDKVMNIDKIRVAGFSPNVSLREGLTRYLKGLV